MADTIHDQRPMLTFVKRAEPLMVNGLAIDQLVILSLRVYRK